MLSIVVRSTSAGVPAPALSPTDIAIATDLAAHLATWCEVRHALRRSQTTSRAARQAAAYEQLLVVLAEAAGSVRDPCFVSGRHAMCVMCDVRCLSAGWG